VGLLTVTPIAVTPVPDTATVVPVVKAGPTALRSPGWNSVTVTNNIITNNVAGWDGAGISLQDALDHKRDQQHPRFQ
jgi:hypothetical protein